MIISGTNNVRISSIGLDDTVEEYPPDSPAALRTGSQDRLVSVCEQNEAENVDASVVFVDIGSPQLDSSPEARMSALLKQSRNSNLENHTAALSVVQTAKDDAKAARAELASTEERLRTTMRAYAALQQSCLEQDHHHNEATKSLVRTMEESRLQSQSKVESLTKKVRDLTVVLKERSGRIRKIER